MYCSGAGSDAEAQTMMVYSIAPKSSQNFMNACDRRLLLPYGYINTNDAGAFLIEDRVDGNGGFSGSAVADDKLALSPTDGNH